MTIKTFIAGALASFVLFGAASAADLPSYKAPPPPPPPPPFSWDGWHIGVSGAYGGGNASYSSNIYSFNPGTPFFGLPTSNSIGTSGYLVGYQSGYNWQFANGVVVGYEDEFSYADIRANTNSFVGGSVARIQWFGTERLRFGYAFGRLLPYITGGLAYGKVQSSGSDFVNGMWFTGYNRPIWQAGWVVGAGLEYAVFDNWSVKAEYQFASLKGPSGSSIGFPAAYRVYQGNHLDTHIARFGVNYNVKSIGALFGWDNLGL